LFSKDGIDCRRSADAIDNDKPNCPFTFVLLQLLYTSAGGNHAAWSLDNSHSSW